MPVGSAVGLLNVSTVVALPLPSVVVELVNEAPLRAALGNAELIVSRLVLYCKVTTAVVTESPAGMFTVTGMPPLSGLGALITRLMESALLPSGPRAKSGMLTVTAVGGGDADGEGGGVVVAANAVVVAVQRVAVGVLEGESGR